jgi:hypothetical protein
MHYDITRERFEDGMHICRRLEETGSLKVQSHQNAEGRMWD